jgi:hypothetical protein
LFCANAVIAKNEKHKNRITCFIIDDLDDKNTEIASVIIQL